MNYIELGIVKNGLIPLEKPHFYDSIVAQANEYLKNINIDILHELAKKEFKNNKKNYLGSDHLIPFDRKYYTDSDIDNATTMTIFKLSLQEKFPSVLVDIKSDDNNLIYYIIFTDNAEYTEFLLING